MFFHDPSPFRCPLVQFGCDISPPLLRSLFFHCISYIQILGLPMRPLFFASYLFRYVFLLSVYCLICIDFLRRACSRYYRLFFCTTGPYKVFPKSFALDVSATRCSHDTIFRLRPLLDYGVSRKKVSNNSIRYLNSEILVTSAVLPEPYDQESLQSNVLSFSWTKIFRKTCAPLSFHRRFHPCCDFPVISASETFVVKGQFLQDNMLF